jgi:hypothetical protein
MIYDLASDGTARKNEELCRVRIVVIMHTTLRTFVDTLACCVLYHVHKYDKTKL